MSRAALVAIDPSQFPERVRRDLRESLRRRQVNHKFHYDSYKQARKWLALHAAWAPSRRGGDGLAVYDQAFAAAAERVKGAAGAHVIGLGCGGGQKDNRLLAALSAPGREVFYTPLDVSLPLVLTAREAALSVVSPARCFPLVCDLGSAEDLAGTLAQPAAAQAARILTFFGMLPNFEPQQILRLLAGLVRRGDQLLLSANLAPGPDYESGVRRVLPQYDNALTRDWLLMFLRDLGVEDADGDLRFGVEPDSAGLGLLRVAADFHFRRACRVALEDDAVEFGASEVLRLFFSYRHTPALVAQLLAPHGLKVVEQWIMPSAEEGVFLVMRPGDS